MGFLHKLWDETLAGPPPETGLGKLRKHDSFSATRSPPMVIPHDDHQVPVTRSITILRTSSHLKNLSADSGSAPGSPSGSSTPGAPHSRVSQPVHSGRYKQQQPPRQYPNDSCEYQPCPTLQDNTYYVGFS